MAERIKLVAGDTRPQIFVAITDKSSGEAIDLSQVELVMHFRAQGSTTDLAVMTGQKLPGVILPDGTADDEGADVGEGGRAVFNWPAAALNVPAGYYEGWIILNFPDGSRQTVYDPVKFKVRADAGG